MDDNSQQVAANPATYSWSDVTSEFFQATKELQLGELLHDELFGLFEAMSAIEMMDPKMDAGMMCNRGDNRIGNFDQAAAEAKVKLEDIDDVELLGVMDTTLACLVTWLEGHSLAQTLFTNLYLHRPQAIIDRTNKAFTISVLKLVDLIRDLISRAQVFEEEDFQPLLYGFKLASEVPSSKASNMLKEVEEDLQKRIKALKLKEADADDSKVEVCVGLHARIRWLRYMFLSLQAFNKKDSISVVDIQRCLAVCQEMGPVIQRTIPYGLQANELSGMPGFEPLVNQRLLPPTFPRYTKIKGRNEAVQYLSTLTTSLLDICNISNCAQFHAALEFFLEFSRNRPCVLSRSLLQLLYVPLYNRSFTELLRDRARCFIAPPVLVPKSPLYTPQTREYVDAFLSHCGPRFLAYIQVCGHNRARQRDKLAALLEDFAQLQDEADKVDTWLHSISLRSENPKPHLACFSTWILYYTLRLMIHYLLSGFELELYSLHEYHYIYWYLFEFLYAWLISALNRAESLLSEPSGETQRGRTAKKKAKKKKPKPFQKEMVTAQALQNLCGGYFRVVMGLRRDKFIRSPQVDQDREQVRYEHRFAAFAPIPTPPAIHYQQFSETIMRGKSTTSREHYLTAAKYFHQARGIFEVMPSPNQEVDALLKIVKHNYIVTKLLADGAGSGSPCSPVQMDFTDHCNFPLLRFNSPV